MIPTRAHRRNRFANRARIVAPDDAGIERELAALSWGDVPDVRHPIARGELARLRSRAATGAEGFPWLSLFVGVLLPIVLVGGGSVALILGLRSLGYPPIVLVLALFPAVFAEVFAIIWVNSFLQARRIGRVKSLVIDALLRMRRCASCGYPLDPTSARGQALVRCAECGAAWALDRLGPELVPGAPRPSASTARAALFLSSLCRSRRIDDRGRRFAPDPMQHAATGQGHALDQRLGLLMSLLPWLLLLAAAPVLCAVGTFLLLSRFGLSPGSVAAVVGAILAAGTIIVATVRHAARVSKVQQLRRRSCLACEQRLRREGELLVCRRCDGAWLRPKRSARRRIPGS